jgi:hypothetical protein
MRQSRRREEPSEAPVRDPSRPGRAADAGAPCPALAPRSGSTRPPGADPVSASRAGPRCAGTAGRAAGCGGSAPRGALARHGRPACATVAPCRPNARWRSPPAACGTCRSRRSPPSSAGASGASSSSTAGGAARPWTALDVAATEPPDRVGELLAARRGCRGVGVLRDAGSTWRSTARTTRCRSDAGVMRSATPTFGASASRSSAFRPPSSSRRRTSSCGLSGTHWSPADVRSG